MDRDNGEGLWPRSAAATVSDPGVARVSEGDAGMDLDGGREFKSGIVTLFAYFYFCVWVDRYTRWG